jgi:uncharacterized protein YkwD
MALNGCASWFEPTQPDVAARLPALEQRIFTLIAEKRQATDPRAHALTLDPRLAVIARRHSADMARTNSFAGTGAPHPVATMLMDQDAAFQGIVGENVAAQHYTPGQDIDVEAFARRFVETWVGSQSHLENLAFADYDRSGVGAAINGDTIYVAQIFTSTLDVTAVPSQGTPNIQTIPSPQQGQDAALPPLRGAIPGPAQPSQPAQPPQPAP